MYMRPAPLVIVQKAAFDSAAMMADFGHGRRDTGAVVSFTGLVRDDTGQLLGIDIEHYPGMTEARLRNIANEAAQRWQLGAVMVIHRYGFMPVGAPIMMVATAARHRSAAFEAAAFLMDFLKSRAPFWKQEISRDGAQWVAAKDTDEAALARW